MPQNRYHSFRTSIDRFLPPLDSQRDAAVERVAHYPLIETRPKFGNINEYIEGRAFTPVIAVGKVMLGRINGVHFTQLRPSEVNPGLLGRPVSSRCDFGDPSNENSGRYDSLAVVFDTYNRVEALGRVAGTADIELFTNTASSSSLQLSGPEAFVYACISAHLDKPERSIQKINEALIPDYSSILTSVS